MANENVITAPWQISPVERVAGLLHGSFRNLPTFLECQSLLILFPHFNTISDFVDRHCFSGENGFGRAWLEDYVIVHAIPQDGMKVGCALECIQLIIQSFDINPEYRRVLLPVLIGCWFKEFGWKVGNRTQIYVDREF